MNRTRVEPANGLGESGSIRATRVLPGGTLGNAARPRFDLRRSQAAFSRVDVDVLLVLDREVDRVERRVREDVGIAGDVVEEIVVSTASALTVGMKQWFGWSATMSP